MRSSCAIVLALAAGLLAACGGQSDADKGPPGSESNPLVAVPNPSRTRTPPTEEPGGERGVTRAASRTATRSSRTQRGTRSTTKGRADGERSRRKQHTLAPSADRPCSLVTKTQARAIIGRPIVEPLEAPQGPTCIYRTAAGKSYITLAVQTFELASLKKQIRNARKVSVSGASAYCGTYGRQMLYLPLSRGRVLSVSAPCSTAVRFAAKAAPHL
jgi:hypothetical protein